jgi:hypothetical protein
VHTVVHSQLVERVHWINIDGSTVAVHSLVLRRHTLSAVVLAKPLVNDQLTTML